MGSNRYIKKAYYLLNKAHLNLKIERLQKIFTHRNNLYCRGYE